MFDPDATSESRIIFRLRLWKSNHLGLSVPQDTDHHQVTNGETGTILFKAMIKLTVMYPNSEDLKFDMDYYRSTHIPMMQRLIGERLKGFSLDRRPEQICRRRMQ
jgi:hypothetical protein